MDNKKIILHIGLYKTASGFLQKYLDSVNEKTYKVFTPKNSTIFMRTLLQYLANPDDKIKEYILSHINEEKNKTIIISSEGILGHQSNGFYFSTNRFKLLEELFKEPKYLIFFREPSSIIYSSYIQGKKNKLNLKFKEYINENIDQLKKNTVINLSQNTNYRIYDYNTILKEYLNIQNRVLFVEYEKFFKERKERKLNNFLGLNLKFNWMLKVNSSRKNLIYFNFYDKYLFFRLMIIFCVPFNRLYIKFLGKIYGTSSPRLAGTFSPHLSVSNALLNILVKFTPKKNLKNIKDNDQKILKNIKKYHSTNYDQFKNKLNPSLHIFSK
ncbi:hypothetical protein N8269_02025 [Candidatus Thioglobus sp.]|nr:hypothetical protein [Candidatus Thioglobus sp.]